MSNEVNIPSKSESPEQYYGEVFIGAGPGQKDDGATPPPPGKDNNGQ